MKRKRKIPKINNNQTVPVNQNNAEYTMQFIVQAKQEITHRKCVYINEDLANLISRIVAVNKNSKITIGGYINAVLEKHFETYKEDIRNYYTENTKPLF